MTFDLNRRAFLSGTASLMGLLGTAPQALASEACDRRFIFVFAQGGWDPTRVFAPAFGNPNVSVEADAAISTKGSLSWVAHESRPAVDSFFDQFHDRSLFINGLLVPSVQHEVCTQMLLTGRAVTGLPDWATAIAADAQDDYVLPHLVAGGPAYPGPHTSSVARAGGRGQLANLLSGRVIDQSVTSRGRLTAPAESIVDRYLQRRAEGRVQAAGGGPDEPAALAFQSALERADLLEDLRYDTNFQSGGSLIEQAGLAIDVLSKGITRCVSLNHVGAQQLGWDTHGDNDAQQAANFESLFGDLVRLMDLLRLTPSSQGGTMADDTVVVVVSEMGRTPLLNNALGKDHWPYTSAMIVGPGITGGRVVGGYDNNWFGAPMNAEASELDEQGSRISASTLGATLLQLAGIDPEATLPGVPVLRDVLT